MGWNWRDIVLPAFASLVWALAASTPAAALIERVGAHELAFQWAPAWGNVVGYLVEVARDGASLRAYTLVAGNRATVSVADSDEIAVAVRAIGRTSDGMVLGPRSEMSDTVRISDPPRLPSDGIWTLHCETCGSLALRRVSGEAPVEIFEAPHSGWEFAGYLQRRLSPSLAVWNGAAAIVFTRPFETTIGLEAFVTGSVVENRRIVGPADFRGFGNDDLVLQDVSSGALETWQLTTDSRLERLWTITGSPGRRLVSTRDLAGDGRSDLLWHEPATGRVEAWILGRGDMTIGILPDRARLAAVGDLDGDHFADLLWQFSDGSLTMWRLVDGLLRAVRTLPMAAGDERRRVVGATDLDGIAGAEIAVQHRDTGDLHLIFPLRPSVSERVLALTPGSRWKAVDLRD